MSENNVINTNKQIGEWIHQYIMPHEDESYSIDNESKVILLELKSSNNTSIRIELYGDSGTRVCGCCDGYFEEYFLIFVDDGKLPYYEVTILYTDTDDDDVELTIKHISPESLENYI